MEAYEVGQEKGDKGDAFVRKVGLCRGSGTPKFWGVPDNAGGEDSDGQ